MSTGKGGREGSRRDVTDKARRTFGPESALRRMFARISAAIDTLRRKASSSSWAALGEVRIPPSWRRPRRLILIGVVLLGIVLIFVTRSATFNSHPAPGTTVFHVGNRVVLRFVHSTGSVHITPGKNGQVSITEHRYGITDAIRTGYRQQGDVITADVSAENGLPATWVDFNVVIPQDTNVNVTVPAGTLSVAGLAGNFALQDTSGSVSAAYDSGSLALQTTSGSISTSQVSGRVSAITDNGTIMTSSTRLGGHSLLQAQNGTINFHGSLDPGSQTVIRNTNGAIGMTLSSRSSVLVNARTPHGSINSQFSSLRVGSDSDGRVADGRLGKGAPARLRIQTMGGSISLNRGP
jgi:Putative adhesin